MEDEPFTGLTWVKPTLMPSVGLAYVTQTVNNASKLVIPSKDTMFSGPWGGFETSSSCASGFALLELQRRWGVGH